MVWRANIGKEGAVKFVQRIIRAALTCAILSAALVGANAWADLTAEQADSLQEKAASGDKAALEKLMAEGRSGNKYAQYELGALYDAGTGVTQDHGQAAQWYRKAAEQGHARAQYSLGVSCERGEGVAQDYLQAAQWYRKAAEQGEASAQYNLGLFYKKGQGVAQDYGQAVLWYRKAAEQGHAFALSNLGVLHDNGQGVPQSKVVAYALYSLSAELDPSDGNRASNNRSLLTREMTKQEIRAGQALARQMMKSESLRPLDQYLAKSATNVPSRK